MIGRTVLLLGWMICAASSTAQEHPFLSHFSVTDAGRSVILDWTMTSGTTCEDTRITRSVDGLSFDVIGLIAGLCGNISEPVDYRFLDNVPPEGSIVHYRLELGYNGSSSIKSIDRSGLHDLEHRFQPSPATDHGELLLGIDPEVRVEIRITDLAGRELSMFSAWGGRHLIDVSDWPAGTYVYLAVVNDQRVIGRFVVL